MILAACHWWIVALWVMFVVYWLIAGIFAKRGAERVGRRRGLAMRLILFVFILITSIVARRSGALQALQWRVFYSAGMAVTGTVLATLGAAVAFTARAAIGRNWGSPGMRKVDTVLVTSGPYRFVRHPIYSGILLMMVGTAIGLMPMWWLVAIAAGIYFHRSARAEEAYMTERFPDDYPKYKARTKMLLPFLL